MDGAAAENARRARAHGILVAPYVFLYPLPHLDPRAQAEYFVTKLQGMGMAPDELPPMIDVEWPPREQREKDGTLSYPWKRWGCSATQIREHAIVCVERCEELTGIVWPFYSFGYYLDCIEAEKEPRFANRPLVIANYKYSGRWPSDDELASLKPHAPWSRISFVQHDGDGGMRLPDGRDADFDCFLGTEDELRALASRRGSPLEVLSETGVDVDLARSQMRGAIVDDAIADYRRTRIDEALAAA